MALRVLGAVCEEQSRRSTRLASTRVGRERAVHIGGRRESPSVGRGVLCARRGKGIRCGSRLLAELSPASVGSLILPGKERSGVGQRESSTRARPPSKIGGRGLNTHRRSVARTRCRSFWRAVRSLAALKGESSLTRSRSGEKRRDMHPLVRVPTGGRAHQQSARLTRRWYGGNTSRPAVPRHRVYLL